MEAVILISATIPFLAQLLFKKFFYFEIAGIISILFHGTYLFGPEIIVLFIATYIISTIAELVSLKTSFYCFGVRYRYNLKHEMFSAKIFLLDVYPIEVTFAWVLLKYVAFCVGILISSAFILPKLAEILLIPLILVSIDFIIDPVAVNINKIWKWDSGTGYFGIPWQNFLGWYLVGLAGTIIFSLFDFSGTVKYSYLFLLPLFFYASVLKNFPAMYKMDRKMAIIGALPACIWTILGFVAFYKLT